MGTRTWTATETAIVSDLGVDRVEPGAVERLGEAEVSQYGVAESQGGGEIVSPDVRSTLTLLRQFGPATVTAIASQRQETRKAAGQRLAWMKACGLITADWQKQARGRPHAIYRVEAGS